jgi:hypothetical protein
VIFAKIASTDRPQPVERSGGAALAPACQACKGPGPVAHATFRQNVGALFARFEKRIQGNMCRRCLSQKFWAFTLTTAAVGWLGMISLFVAPIYVVMNIVEYVKASSRLRQGTVPELAAAPIHPT